MRFNLIDQKRLHRGFFRLDAYTVEHECFNGGTQTICREHLERGDAVAVLLFDPARNEVLLIEQFRIGPAVRGDEAWLIEIVAGMIDEGEDAEAAARREAVEEAGYEPATLQHLGRYYSTPGGSSECIDLFLGEVDRGSPVADGGGISHEHEDIRIHWVSRRQAMQWLHSGRINSGAPMLALLMAFGCEGVVKSA
ncbi:MAG: NUDIX domain-containing protein [Mariprofundaceae bacterium]